MKFDHGKALTRAEALEALKARWEFEKRTEHVHAGACLRRIAMRLTICRDIAFRRSTASPCGRPTLRRASPTPANGCVACTSPRPIPAMTSPTSSTRS